MSVSKVCDELELTFGQCESDPRTLLKKEGINDPTEEQLEDALNCVEEEHHTIMFLYKSNRQRFGSTLWNSKMKSSRKKIHSQRPSKICAEY